MWKPLNSEYRLYILFITVLAISFFNFIGCSDSSNSGSGSDSSISSTATTSDDSTDNSITEAIVENCEDHDDPNDYIWETADVIYIQLNETSITTDGGGSTINGSVITINSAGTYSVTGTLTDGQIIVDTDDENIVRIILSGAHITSSTGAPVHINNAEKAMVVLDTGTENTLVDGTSHADDDEATASLYSEDDLTIYGDGSLIVTGNFNDGIAGKDGLIISSGNITVNATDNGIRGKDYLVINGGEITIIAEGDGLKSDNDEDNSEGYIAISAGFIEITAGGDGLQAETDVSVTAGELVIKTGGGSSFSDSSSAKGIKATADISIDGGIFTLDTAGDAIHSKGELTINNGNITLSTGDDGLHSDGNLTINNGEIIIADSYEGIESAEGNITINGGDIRIVSDDDGVNLAESGNYYLYINGGYLVVDSTGDGIDANASVVMTDGDVIVHGPSASNNSAIDYDGSFSMDGGFLVAAGSYSSRLTQTLGTSSEQDSILITFNSSLSAGTLIHIEDSEGNDILTFEPTDDYQSIVFSSPDLERGTTYSIYYGGSSTGTEVDGLYTGGTYTSGTKYTDFIINYSVTTIN